MFKSMASKPGKSEKLMPKLKEVRGYFAKMMANASGSNDPRLEHVFELVPREAFLGKGPWKIWIEGKYIDTPSADPIHVYQNNLVALDASQGINNGEPFLHARWIGTVAPQKGETVTHIGTGTGYYTAILSMLVLPGGQVFGIELNSELAASARKNLLRFENAHVVTGDAVSAEIRPSDIIYVNAGVVVPPLNWLFAMRPGGRLIFPWRPSQKVGIAMLITREPAGFAALPIISSWFIPCVGASLDLDGDQAPDDKAAWQIKSLHLMTESQPNDTAVAVYQDVWFSTATLF